ncbi:Scarecrow-like protein 33 [Morella rubra]|uniref:Scarecrow-like protein 33 n=1 Tax=Morella rubra TaxID=262757 RepID=A0A6A1WQ40_9ROSI|nr:Scarecrow-like protein 33 [Morella rubra]
MSGSEDFINGTVVVDEQAISLSSKQFPNLVNEFHFNIPSVDLDFLENPFLRPDLGPMGFPPQIFGGQTAETYSPSASADSLSTSSMGMSPGAHSPSDDSEFSETVLRYMSQILMEEDIEDKPCMFYDPLGLQITEKSFYDALSQENPPPPPSEQPPCLYPNLDSLDDFVSGSSGDYATNSSSTTSTSTDPQGLYDLEGYKSSFSQATLPGDYVLQHNFLPNNGSLLQTNPLNVVTGTGDGLELLARNIFSDSESVLQFRRGLEEASKFLPRCNQLLIDPESSTGSTESNGENPKGAR